MTDPEANEALPAPIVRTAPDSVSVPIELRVKCPEDMDACINVSAIGTLTLSGS